MIQKGVNRIRGRGPRIATAAIDVDANEECRPNRELPRDFRARDNPRCLEDMRELIELAERWFMPPRLPRQTAADGRISSVSIPRARKHRTNWTVNGEIETVSCDPMMKSSEDEAEFAPASI
jgi:hypothetical protein